MALPGSNPAVIKAAGGEDYTTVTAWEADLDDATLDANYEAQLEGLSGDNAVIDFVGINADSQYAIKIKAKSGFEASGTNEATCAAVDVRIRFGEATEDLYCFVEGIDSQGSPDYGIDIDLDNAASEVTITKSVFRDCASNTIYIEGCGDVAIRIGVCLFTDCAGGAWTRVVKLDDADIATEFKFYNCTIYAATPPDNSDGVAEVNGSFTDLRNAAVCMYDNNANANDYSGAPSNMSNCFSSGEGTGNTDTLRDDGTDWTDAANDDFTLKDTNSVLYHAGSVPGGGWPSWMPSTDLAGTSFHATTPSVGCYEYVAAGLSIPNPLHRPLAGPIGGPL